MKALIFGEEKFEDQELFYPLNRLKEDGIEVHIASTEKRKIKGKHGYEIEADLAFWEVDPSEYALLVIAGGKAPEKIRLDARALEIVKRFFKEKKPVAAICHGPQVLVSAGVVKGRKATCYIGIRDDLIAAGALYEDKEVVVDGNLVTSRHPFDLYAFGREMMKLLR